jgi:hypothetical protein
MRYSDQEALVSGLRELADFFDQNIEFPNPYGISVNVSVTEWKPWEADKESEVDQDATKRELKRCMRLMRNCEKVWSSYSLRLTKKFGTQGKVTLNVSAERSGICRKVVLGNEIIPAQPERVVEKVEWVCDDVALLAISD